MQLYAPPCRGRGPQPVGGGARVIGGATSVSDPGHASCVPSGRTIEEREGHAAEGSPF